jgi:hypothetical protein
MMTLVERSNWTAAVVNGAAARMTSPPGPAIELVHHWHDVQRRAPRWGRFVLPAQEEPQP